MITDLTYHSKLFNKDTTSVKNTNKSFGHHNKRKTEADITGLRKMILENDKKMDKQYSKIHFKKDKR